MYTASSAPSELHWVTQIMLTEFFDCNQWSECDEYEDCKEIKRVRRGRRGGKKVRGRSEHAKLLRGKHDHECYGAKHKVPACTCVEELQRQNCPQSYYEVSSRAG